MSIYQGLCGSGSGVCAAWKGDVGDDRLFFGAFNGSKWDLPGNTIPGNSSVGPGLATMANGLIYAAWKGEVDDDTRLFYATFDVSKRAWSSQTQIPNVASSIGPSLAAIGNTLYGAWVGVNNDLSMHFFSFDPSRNNTNWSSLPGLPAGAKADFTASSIGPALAAIGTKLYAAWADTNGDIIYAALDASTTPPRWTIPTSINQKTRIGPSLASLGGKLYAAWSGEGSDQTLYFASLDPSKPTNQWSSPTQIPNAASSIGPALAAAGSKLYAIWKGQNDDQSMYFAWLDPSKPTNQWSTQSAFGGNTGQDLVPPPAAGLGGNSNYWLYSDCQPLMDLSVTIEFTEDLVGNKGMGCQLNAVSAAGHAVGWQQHFMGIGPTKNAINYGIQLWGSTTSEGIVFDPRPPGNDDQWPMPSLTIPNGYKLKISLTTDPTTQNITAATFSVIDNTGKMLQPEPPPVPIPKAFQAPIIAFQLNLSGPGGDVLSSGAGTITYTASNPLTVLRQAPPCPVGYPTTAETTNSCYVMLPPTTSSKITQPFGISP